MKKLFLFKLSLFLIIMSSCTSYRDVSYFQGTDRTRTVTQAITNSSPLTIQPGDVLGLNVGSLNPLADMRYNMGSASAGASGGGSESVVTTPGSAGTVGYTVDQKGEIHLPAIPPVKVGGLTITQAQTLVANSLTVLKEPSVNLRILNFKVSVLGDVGRPGVFNISNEKSTIVDAISQAGDLAITAKRNNILLVREVDGERKFINVDITTTNIFNSPYYYLKNNDIIYVEGSKAKYASINGFNRGLPIALSLLSVAIGVIGIVIINRK